MEYELIHIYTRTPRPHEVDEYVYNYAKWLGAKLTVIMPDKSFAEFAETRPYWPSLEPERRWCYYELKLKPIIRYLEHFDGKNTLHVMAIRRDESLFRRATYNSTFARKCYREDLCIDVWMPLLFASDYEVNKLLNLWNIPKSPVWSKLGFSGECFCLAGTTEKTIVKIKIYYPEVLRELLEIDKIIQENRTRSDTKSYPPFLRRRGITLTEFAKELDRQLTLDGYFEYTGKACQGSCMLY